MHILIAFDLRELLNVMTPHSHIDSLFNYLAFTVLRHPLLIFWCCFPLAFIYITLPILRSRKGDYRNTRDALQALATVMAPRCSFWPGRYVKFASTPRLCINLPLETIIEDIMDGIIEFRDPENDLLELMDSGVNVNGYTICIKIGWRWWFNCFESWIHAKSSSVHSPRYLEPSDWFRLNRWPANSCSALAATSSSPHGVFCLEYLHRGTIPSLNSGCKMVLEYSAFSPSLRMLSMAQIISAVPFINLEHPRCWPRTVVSVPRPPSASYTSNLTIDSLSNVSVDYEHALRHLYRSNFQEHETREKFVKILGMKAWRRCMFLLALEAALVRRGWIERWAIQIAVN